MYFDWIFNKCNTDIKKYEVEEVSWWDDRGLKIDRIYNIIHSKEYSQVLFSIAEEYDFTW